MLSFKGRMLFLKTVKCPLALYSKGGKLFYKTVKDEV